MFGLRIDFGCMRVLPAEHTASIFNNRKLHAVTEAKKGNLILSAKFYGRYFAFNTAFTKAAWHQNTLIFWKFFNLLWVAFIVFGVQPVNFGLQPQMSGWNFERFNNRNVSVGKHEIARIKIFAHNADFNFLFAVFKFIYKSSPFLQVLLSWFQSKISQNNFRKFITFKIERHIIYWLHIWRRNHIFRIDTGRRGHFFLPFIVKRHLASSDYNIGIHSVRGKLADGILGRLGFHFANFIRYRKIANKHKEHILRIFQFYHSGRLDKNSILIFAYGAANFNHRNFRICFFNRFFNSSQYFFGDVEDRLNAFTLVAKSSFFINHIFENHAVSHVIFWRWRGAQKSFVITHVLVGLQSRIKHKNFPVFSGVHGASINIQIGVGFDEGNFITLRLKDCAYRRGSNAFADSRHHASDYKYVFMPFFNSHLTNLFYTSSRQIQNRLLITLILAGKVSRGILDTYQLNSQGGSLVEMVEILQCKYFFDFLDCF